MGALPKEEANELGGSIYIIRRVPLGIDWTAFQKVQCPRFLVIGFHLVHQASSELYTLLSKVRHTHATHDQYSESLSCTWLDVWVYTNRSVHEQGLNDPTVRTESERVLLSP